MTRGIGLFLPLIVCLQVGCGAVISVTTIGEAELALDEARFEQAEEFATYEFVTAEQYLDKAHEEWAYSDFQHAEAYSQYALEMAQAARERAINDPNRNAPSFGHDDFQ